MLSYSVLQTLRHHTIGVSLLVHVLLTCCTDILYLHILLLIVRVILSEIDKNGATVNLKDCFRLTDQGHWVGYEE